MVASVKDIKRNVYLCGVCGAAYLNFKEALICEEGHKRNDESSGDELVDDAGVETRGGKRREEGQRDGSSSTGLMKYNIVVRDSFRNRVHSFSLEAPGIRAAAEVVRARFPHHNGYEIRSA
jgi:hypothetical protein